MNDQDRQPRDFDDPRGSDTQRGVGRERRFSRLVRRLIPAALIAGACLTMPMLAQAAPLAENSNVEGIVAAESTLGDEEIGAITADIQAGFVAPEAHVEEAAASDGSGGVPKWLPWALLGGVVVVLIAFGSRTIGVIDRRTVPWFDATLKATAVVIGMILLTTIIPAKVIESDAVRDLSRNAQDLITMGFWAVGLFGGLWALWWAHRENRI